MYDLLKRLVFPLLKVEDRRPAPPSGPHETFEVVRACPAYLAYNLFYWKLYAAAWALGVGALSFALLIINRWLVLVVVPLLLVAAFKAAVLYAVTRLAYDTRWYVITDRSLLIREGVWVVREITLTFANAQNVRVTQGPLQRLFGFSDVEVDTAGGGGSTGPHGERSARPHRAVLRGLEDAARVRDLILEQLRRHRTAGLGDPDDHAAAPSGAGDSGAVLPLPTALLDQILDEARRVRRALESI